MHRMFRYFHDTRDYECVELLNFFIELQTPIILIEESGGRKFNDTLPKVILRLPCLTFAKRLTVFEQYALFYSSSSLHHAIN